MQKTILTIAIIVISFGFGFAFKSMIETRSAPLPSKRVTGIGGIFFKCKDPGKVKEWYKTHLGLNTDQYGTNFQWWQGADSSKRGYTQWSPFKETTHYFAPSTKEFNMSLFCVNAPVNTTCILLLIK